MTVLGTSLYRKILGHPFVYDQIRPRVVGGIDMRPLYDHLGPEERAFVLDVGCGTGDALRHLAGFEGYLGIDTDEQAVSTARARFGERPRVRFECRTLTAEDVAAFQPTAVVLSGVLHHLTNDEAEGLLHMVTGSRRLRRVVTSDIVFLPGALWNNLLAMMDRGRYCRDPDAYASVARRAGLHVVRASLMTPGSGSVRYHTMVLEPPREPT